MAYRVEELAAKAEVSVDTVRYYQAKDLLAAPRRIGRVAWYDDAHVDRLATIRRLQGRGLSLAVIRRLLVGELDHADEELVAALAEQRDDRDDRDDRDQNSPSESWLTLADLATRTGIPLS